MLSLCGAPASALDLQPTRARVVHVASGDRVSLELEGRRLTVRLAGVRAPDLHTAPGRAARRVLGNLALNRLVSLGRATRRGDGVAVSLYLGGTDLSEYLVSAGIVFALPDHPTLLALELRARRSGRGLWAGSSLGGHRAPPASGS